jgi:nicotinamide mononucleotide transporter
MPDAQSLLAAVTALSAWEIAAVVLALAYLVLAIRQHIACWIAALLSAGIYLYLAFDATLYMQAALQLFYMAMAVYGWWCWRGGAAQDTGLPVTSWAARQHRLPLLLILVSGALLGLVLQGYSNAASPFLDAWVATAAVVATWMVARKVLQNWHYWFVIDAASAFLYASQGLWLTALLFVLYLVLIVLGYRQWKHSMVADDV